MRALKKMVHKFMIIFFLINCTVFSQYGSSSERGGILKYSEELIPTTYDPITVNNNMASYRMSQLIFEPLVSLDKYNQPLPLLAKSWTIVEENKIVRFILRDSVSWHDEAPFSKDDVLFTYESLRKDIKNINAPYSQYAQEIENIITQGNTITFTMKNPNPDIVKFFSKIYIYPRHKFQNNVLQPDNSFIKQPIGTGPFRFKREEDGGKKVILERNPFYYNNVNLDAIICRVEFDPDLAVQSLKHEGIDMKVTLPRKEIGPIEATGNIKVYPYSSQRIDAIAMNFKNELLAKKEIREAMVWGSDRQTMINKYYFGYGQLISGPYPPGSSGFNPNVFPDPYDKDKAKRNLQIIGAEDDNSDGIREFNDKELSFDLLVPIRDQNIAEINVATGFQNAMMQLGIKINIVRLEWNSFIKKVVEERDFDLAYLSIVYDEVPDISSYFYSEAGGAGRKNLISYKNEKVDDLLEELESTYDFEKKRTINYKLHALLAEDKPYIFLWTLESYSGYHKKIRRIVIHPYKFFQDVNSWYIDPEYRY